jgi:MtN3 and saliva related transmembrane protein
MAFLLCFKLLIAHQTGTFLTIYDILQLVSGVLAVSAFIPQIVKTLKTKSVGDISPPMFALNVIAATLAEFYALNLWKEQDEPAFLITNSMILLGSSTLLFLLLRYRKRK